MEIRWYGLTRIDARTRGLKNNKRRHERDPTAAPIISRYARTLCFLIRPCVLLVLTCSPWRLPANCRIFALASRKILLPVALRDLRFRRHYPNYPRLPRDRNYALRDFIAVYNLRIIRFSPRARNPEPFNGSEKFYLARSLVGGRLSAVVFQTELGWIGAVCLSLCRTAALSGGTLRPIIRGECIDRNLIAATAVDTLHLGREDRIDRDVRVPFSRYNEMPAIAKRFLSLSTSDVSSSHPVIETKYFTVCKVRLILGALR